MRKPFALAALTLVAGCGRSVEEQHRALPPGAQGARVGVDSIPAVHLLENHSDALIAWRRAGVRDRILVHLGGHIDLDWLPDTTIARLAAADPEQLEALELHPYAMDGKTLAKFGSSNVVYPAARLGIVREYVWVVPDGTLRDAQAADDLVRHVILGRLQMISLDEARTLHSAGRVIRGTVLGVKIAICELADLPAFDEPVLLDVSLDFLTTRSAGSQEVLSGPTLAPLDLVERLRSRGVRTDLATVSFSTIGGFCPPACRWLGPATVEALKGSRDPSSDRWVLRAQTDVLVAAGRDAESATTRRAIAAMQPEDGSIWYEIARAEERSGHAAAEAVDRAKAIAADPILADAPLFEADTDRLNRRYAEALEGYRDYRRKRAAGAFLAYALRREAECLRQTGRSDEAIATLRTVIALAPDHADTRLDLSVLLREGGDFDGEIAQLLEARRLLPDLATYARALGLAYAHQDRLADAVEALEAAVLRRPTWGAAQLDLGLLLASLSRPVDAAAHLNAASMLEPRDPQIGRVLARLRRQGISTTEVAAHP